MKENKNFNILINYIMPISFLFVASILIYLVNKVVPFMMDDIWYSTKLYNEEPIQNISDIIQAQVWHYNNWGGRSIAHGILQITLLLGDKVVNVLNVVMMLILTYSIGVVAKQKSVFYGAIILGMMVAFNANWKESLFWQSGACNYLYITVFILVFLATYLRKLDQRDWQPIGISIFIMPLGLIVGWSNENMGPTLWVLTLFCMFLYYKKHSKVPIWMILGSISCLMGSALLILAPGNGVRLEEAAQEIGLLWQVYLRCYYIARALLDYMMPIVLTAVGITVFWCGYLKEKLGQTQIILLAGAILSWGAMILSPHYPERATFGTVIFLICYVINLAGCIIAKKTEVKKWFGVFGIFIWLAGMYVLFEYLSISWGWIK